MSMNVTSPSLIFRQNNPALSTPILATPLTSVSLFPTAASSVLPATTLVARQVTVTAFSTLETATSSLIPTQTPSIDPSVLSNNNTKALPAAANNPPREPYYFSFALFLLLFPMLPLLASFLNLTLPSIIRIISQSTSSLRRSPKFTPLMFLSYYIAIYWILPLSLSHAGTTNPKLRLTSLSHAGQNPISTPSFVLSFSVTSLIFLTNLATTILYHKNPLKLLVWLVFGLVLLATYCIDYFSDWERGASPNLATGLGLSGVVPVLFLLGIWGVPRILGSVENLGRKKGRDNREKKRLEGMKGLSKVGI